jgi:hypothetical protein
VIAKSALAVTLVIAPYHLFIDLIGSQFNAVPVCQQGQGSIYFSLLLLICPAQRLSDDLG